MLSERDLVRYARQILIPGLGERGQEKLKNSQVVIAGIGGLGCPASIYLAVAGVGHLRLIDSDKVELSNLNRQILHWDENIGELKASSAQKKLPKFNPDIEIKTLKTKITEETVDELLSGADVVIDAMDNFETRFILNETCVRKGIPFIHGSIYGLEGKITTIIPGRTPCLSCIYPTKPFEKRPFPVLGATPALVACLQVMETIKLIGQFGKLLTNRMLIFDAERMEFRTFAVSKRENCPVCGNGIVKEL